MGFGIGQPPPEQATAHLDPEHLDHQIGDPRPRVLLVRVGFDPGAAATVQSSNLGHAASERPATLSPWSASAWR